MPTDALVCSSVKWEGGVSGGGSESCSLCSQNVSGLTLRTKLLSLIIDLAVILKYLGVIHL